MHGEVEQGDFLAVAGRHPDRLGQILCHGIIWLHLPALDHVLQQQRGKCLRDGTDLEQGVAIHFLVGTVIQLSVADNAAAMLVHNADHHAAVPFFNLDAMLNERTDGIGEIFRRSVKGKRR